jgi:hypothetical protein
MLPLSQVLQNALVVISSYVPVNPRAATPHFRHLAATVCLKYAACDYSRLVVIRPRLARISVR